MRRPYRLCLVCLGCCVLFLECKEDHRPGTPPDLPIAAIDASLDLGRAQQVDASRPTEIAQDTNRLVELQGSWWGQADTDEFGWVRAELNVDAEGQVRSQVDGPGLHRIDLFVLTRWDGTILGVQLEDGTEVELEAELRADEFHLVVPQVGTVILHRRGRRKGL